MSLLFYRMCISQTMQVRRYYIALNGIIGQPYLPLLRLLLQLVLQHMYLALKCLYRLERIRMLIVWLGVHFIKNASVKMFSRQKVRKDQTLSSKIPLLMMMTVAHRGSSHCPTEPSARCCAAETRSASLPGQRISIFYHSTSIRLTKIYGMVRA